MYDKETDLAYLNARYYDGGRGQFTSQDPAFSDLGFDLTDPQSMNSYSYARNNPITMVDRDGEMFEYFALIAAHYYINNSSNVPYEIRQVDFAATHPYAAARIGTAYDNGTGNNISTVASNFAINATKPDASMKDTNALRHVVWQAMISKEFGADIATKAGNAHENNPFVDLSNRVFTNADSADQTADLLNNQIGRSLYSNNPNANNTDYAKSAVEYMYKNGLYTTSKSRDGIYTVNQVKINISQRDSALKVISGLKNNGLKNK